MSRTLKIVLLVVISIVAATFIVIYKIPAKSTEVFIDQNGKEVRLEEFKGKVVLMNFIYTSCHNKGCDALSLQFLRAQLLLKNRLGKDFFLISVSIDPEKDTPEVLKGYARKFKADPDSWFFLTSSPVAVEKLMKKYAVEWKTDPDGKRHHKAVMALLDRDGRKVAEYNDYNYETAKIIEDITRALGPDK